MARLYLTESLATANTLQARFSQRNFVPLELFLNCLALSAQGDLFASDGTETLSAATWVEKNIPLELRRECPKLVAKIEALRAAFLFTEDEIEFALEGLGTSPKARILGSALRGFAAEADSTADIAVKIYRACEQIRAGSPLGEEWENLSEIVLLRDLESMPAVDVLADALKHHPQIEQVRVEEIYPALSAEAALGPLKRPVLVRQTDALLFFCQSLEKVDPDQALWIDYVASPKEVAWLHSALRASGRELKAPRMKTESLGSAEDLWDQGLAKLRADTELPLSFRLEWNHRLLTMRHRSPTRSFSLDRLAPMDRDRLAKYFESTPAVDRTELPTFYCTPNPIPPGVTALTFLGNAESFFSDAPFEPSEAARLAQRGFNVPCRRSRRLRWNTWTRFLAQSEQSRRLIFSIQEEIPGARNAKLQAPRALARLPRASDVKFLPGSPEKLSATAIQTFARCPAKFFYERRLGLRAPPKFAEEIRRLLGIAVHRALLWKHSEHQEAPDSVPIAWTSLWNRAATEFPEEVREQRLWMQPLEKSFFALVSRHNAIEADLKSLLGASSTTSLEVEFAWNFPTPGGHVAIRGAIDRIETLADGSQVLIDYKTGKVDFTPDHAVSGKNLQAAVYWLWANESKKSHFLLYDLKEGQVRRGLFHRDSLSKESQRLLTRGHALDPEKAEGLLEKARLALQATIERIQRGEIEPTPSNEACGFCSLGPLCRKKEGMLDAMDR